MIDTHVHCFERGSKLASGARYCPQYDALLAHLQTHWQAHGITQGVIIQPSFLGTDNSHMLHICEHSAHKIRAVAVVSPTISFDELFVLHTRGVRGIRFNWAGLAPWPDVAGSAWAHVRRDMRMLGWHAELHIEGHRLNDAASHFDAWDVPLIIDHLGRPSSISIDTHAQTLQSIFQRRSTYIKVSAPYRCNADAPGSFEAVTHGLLDCVGAQHLLWGSDWPFTQFEESQTYDAVVADYKRVCCDAIVQAAMTRNAEILYFS